MTTDALVWGLIGLAAFLVAVAIVVHEVFVARRNREACEWLDAKAGRDERAARAAITPHTGHVEAHGRKRLV